MKQQLCKMSNSAYGGELEMCIGRGHTEEFTYTRYFNTCDNPAFLQ